MKKLLLGAMMSALFVMNADAGIFNSIKKKVVQVQHKIKGDRSMDEKTEIQPFKMYLKDIIKTAGEFYKILEEDEKNVFKSSQDNINKFVIFARTAYNKKVTTYDENAVKECINGIKGSFVLSVLDSHREETQCTNFIAAIGRAIDFAQKLETKYTDNKVLARVVDGLMEIKRFVTGEEARLRAEAIAQRQAEADQQAIEDYNFRLQEAARLEAEATRQKEAVQRQAEADQQAIEDYNFKLQEAARLEAEADQQAIEESSTDNVVYGEPETFGSTETLVINENTERPLVNNTSSKLQELQETQQLVQQTPVKRSSSSRGRRR